MPTILVTARGEEDQVLTWVSGRAAWAASQGGGGFTNSARHPYEFSAASLGNNAYLACDGGSTQASSGTISSRRRFRARTAGTLSKLIVDLDTAPGAGTSRTFTVRINEVDSALAVTISDTNTLSSEDIDTVAVAAGDRIELWHTSAGAVAASVAHGVVETTYA